MFSRPVCRLCLSIDAPMHNIVDSPLRTVYEKLTSISLHAAPRPVAACYLCYCQLRKCHKLMVRSLKADKILTELQQHSEVVNLELITIKKREIQELNELVITSLQHIVIGGPGHSPSNINIKEEPLSPQCKEEVDTDRRRYINYLTFEDSESEEHFGRVIRRDVESIDNDGLMDIEINKQSENTAYIERDVFPGSVDIKHEKLGEIESHVRSCTVHLEFESEDDNNRNELTFEGGTEHEQPLLSQHQELMETDRRRCIDYLKFEDSQHEGDMERVTVTDVEYIGNEEFIEDKEIKDEESEEKVNVESVEASGAAAAEKCKQTHAGKIQDGSTLTPGTKNILKKPRTRSTVVEEAMSRNIGRHLLRGTKTANNRQSSTNSYSDTAIYKSNISIGSDNDDCGNVFDEKHLLIERIIAVKKTSHPKRLNRTGIVDEQTGTHRGDKLLECDICKLPFTRKDSLKTHLRIHTGEKPYECEICKGRFSEKSGLKKHLRIHTGEKPYECAICKVRYRHNSSLKYHLKVHTGEKPYECEICKVRFINKASLRSHLRIHTKEKPYECEICRDRFSEKGSLKKHLRIHTGEKLYKCEICKIIFTRKAHLEQHLKIHTGENSEG